MSRKAYSSVNVPALASAPASPLQGDIYYDTVAVQLKYYDGAGWDTIVCSEDVSTVVGQKTFSSKTIHRTSDTAAASIGLPHGAAPTSPVNGDIWTTTAGIYVRVNGATVGPLGAGGGSGGATVSATPPSTPTSGQIWYDSTGGGTYVYYDSFWVELGSPVTPSGATGGGANKAFFENDQTVTSDYTITAGKNAVSAGPITVNTGVIVTIPSGSTWTVV